LILNATTLTINAISISAIIARSIFLCVPI
jgi:hypothetical protein